MQGIPSFAFNTLLLLPDPKHRLPEAAVSICLMEGPDLADIKGRWNPVPKGRLWALGKERDGKGSSLPFCSHTFYLVPTCTKKITGGPDWLTHSVTAPFHVAGSALTSHFLVKEAGKRISPPPHGGFTQVGWQPSYEIYRLFINLFTS